MLQAPGEPGAFGFVLIYQMFYIADNALNAVRVCNKAVNKPAKQTEPIPF